MKKILLLSDTHSFIDEQLLKFVRQADEVWHAGDIGNCEVTNKIKAIKPLRAVYGNIDNTECRTEFPLDNIFTIERVKVWITHIGGYPKRYDKRVANLLKEIKPNLFISGHSHILKVMFDKQYNLLHMNPGAAGIYGFHQIRTMLRFNINDDKIENLEVIELAKK
ncbi:metallophosphatase family protein [Flavobacteriaceae bacterium F08102]|nr:metallophosphatase family protein [Flavobacteriaceae bacterium F08102]